MKNHRLTWSGVVVVKEPEECLLVNGARILVPKQRHVGEAAVAGGSREGAGGHLAARLTGDDVGEDRARLDADVDLRGKATHGASNSTSHKK